MPGRQSRQVTPRLLSLLRDDAGRGIKAVINYAITRFYLKIKTVFFASMRLTDSHIALTSSRDLLFHSLASFVFFALFSIRADCQVANPLASAGCEGCAISIFSPARRPISSPPRPSLAPPLPPLSRRPRTLAGLFVTLVFPGHSWFRAHFRRPKAVPFSPLNQLCALHKSPSNHYTSLSLSISLSLSFALCAATALWVYIGSVEAKENPRGRNIARASGNNVIDWGEQNR